MRTLALAAAAAFAAAFASPAVADACEKASEIRAAFEPRLDYEHERARRVAPGDADWPPAILRQFAEIRADGLDCRAVYDRYDAFLDEVITRNDRLEQATPASRGMIFRKW